ncbi:MAG: cobalamin biosynthesis protein CobW [Hyphomicrobiales bacterium]|nr:cobalamin biosynthesis protein CobW [Hyphomicrobiales bacterium]
MQSGPSSNNTQTGGKIRATVVTGFLGAGKTTLIRHLIENAGGRKIALIINEFGDLGIDGDVLANCEDACCTEDDIIELANGCICCTVADDFIPTMTRLLEREDPPEHIVIETSGLALPQPLIRAFGWPEIRARVTVDGVVAIVDGMAVAYGRFAENESALEAQRQNDENLDHESPLHELFEDQVGCADLIIVSKGDLVSHQKMTQITSDLSLHARPGVRFLAANHGKLNAEILLGLSATAEDDIANRLSHHEKEHGGEELDHEHDDFDSFVVQYGQVADQEDLLNRIRQTVIAHDILRIKGFASVEDKAMRLQIQGVGPRIDHYYDRPWQPEEPRQTSLVVIGLSGMDQDAIRQMLTS